MFRNNIISNAEIELILKKERRKNTKKLYNFCTGNQN